MYKNWLDYYVAKGEKIPKQVYIFGHSLGLADFGVLKEFFVNEKIHQTRIFYHNNLAYENLVINLVKALEKEFVVEGIGNGRIAFEELSEPCLRSKTD